MNSKLKITSIVTALLLSSFILFGFAPTLAVSAHACNPPAVICTENGRMTGGGRFDVSQNFAPAPQVTPILLTHGFEVHCNASISPNNIEVNWQDSSGAEHHFHLDTLTTAQCQYVAALGSPNPPTADFNLWVGSGTGSYDNVTGAHIYAIFTDQGQPAAGKDPSTIVIYAADGTLVLNWSGVLQGGAQQAHDCNGNANNC